MLTQIAEFLQSSVLSFPEYLFDANRRTFGLYLLSAMMLAIPAYLIQKRQRSVRAFFGYLFNKRVWLHSSARLDYVMFIVNRVLRALIWAPVVLTMVPVAIGFSDSLEAVFGLREPVISDPVWVMVWFTLILFILDDATRFLLHLAFHKIPILWEFHKVHHSAKVLTPMTIYRSHPLESYLYACRLALAQGLAVGVGYYLFGTALSMYDLLGANIFVFVFNIMGANLRHSHVWWSWGNRVESWFISPAQHQIHHSDNPIHFDRNLGSALAIWDRMCGTLVKSKGAPKIRFGLGRHQAHHTSLWQSYVEPLKSSVGHLKNLIPGRIRSAAKQPTNQIKPG